MRHLIKPAKELLKAYFSDGYMKTPCDLENDLLGGADFSYLTDLLGPTIPRWNKTPFCIALGELVKGDIVKFKRSEDGSYVYWMPLPDSPTL